MCRQQQCCITHAPAQSGREQKNTIKEESYRDMEQKRVAFGVRLGFVLGFWIDLLLRLGARTTYSVGFGLMSRQQ